MSPSSRRAWIEILKRRSQRSTSIVALLAEGVDRNLISAVRLRMVVVALLAEGVDRNLLLGLAGVAAARRPPRGGRG